MTSSPRPPWAARRAASTLSRRGWRTHAHRSHVADESGRSRCGGDLLDQDNAEPLAEVADWLRCRRAGCRERWPAAADRAPVHLGFVNPATGRESHRPSKASGEKRVRYAEVEGVVFVIKHNGGRHRGFWEVEPDLDAIQPDLAFAEWIRDSGQWWSSPANATLTEAAEALAEFVASPDFAVLRARYISRPAHWGTSRAWADRLAAHRRAAAEQEVTAR